MKQWHFNVIFFFVIGVPAIIFAVGLFGYNYRPPSLFVGAYMAMSAWVLRHQVGGSPTIGYKHKKGQQLEEEEDDDDD